MLTASHHPNGFHCVCKVPISSTLRVLEHFGYESSTMHLTAPRGVDTLHILANIKYLHQKYVIPDTREVSAEDEHSRVAVEGGRGGT